MATGDLKAKLVIEAQTDGGGDIQKLASQLDALAREGGNAAPQMAELAQTLRGLARQESAVQGFMALQDQVRASEKTFKALAREADAYARQINASGPPTAREAANLEKLRTAADRAGSTLAHQRTLLAASTANMQRHGIATDGAGAALRRIQADLQQAAQSAIQLDPRLQGVARGWRATGEAAQAAGQRAGAAAEAMGSRISATGQAAHRMAGQLAAAFTVREALQAVQDMEKLQAGLRAVTGDAAKARAEMDFVGRVAAQAGVDVVAAGNAYLGLAAATRGTAVEGQATRDVFVAVSSAMARAGKSSGETSNALMALQQMAGKGVVSMEEMRQQLGEALPGAFQAAASGMGITTQQLNKLIESGQVTARDLFPALTKGLNELYGSAEQGQTLSQEITNIKNAFVEMAAYIGEAGGTDALKVWAERAQAAVTMLGVGLVDFGKKAGTIIGALVARDFSQVGQAFADIEAEGRDKLVKAALHNEQLRGAIEALGTEAENAALAVAQQGAATVAAGAQAATAAPSYAALGAAYADVRKELAAQIELASKEVAAAKARGEAAVAEIKLKGDEAALRQAIGKAAADEADALTSLAQKRQTEVDVLRAELDNKQVLLKVSGDNSDERKKEIDDLDQLLEKKQVEADVTRGQAAAAQAEALARGEQAQAAQAALSSAQAVTAARVGEARANLSLLESQRSLASQGEQLARMRGNEDAARRYRIQQLEVEVKITRAKAGVTRAEAMGAIATAQATMDELRARGELTKVKEAELNASIKQGEARLVEAAATEKSSALLEQAISNLRNYGDEAGAAGDKAAAGMRRAADATREAGDAAAEGADEARRAHEEAAQATEFTWLSAATQVSRHADEAARHAEAMAGSMAKYMGASMSWGQYIGAWNSYYGELRRLAEEYADSLERLDARQQELERRNSGASRGVEDLRMRLLELNGTEDEIARARAQRERAEIERQIQLAQLEVERAAVRGDHGAAARFGEEIALLREQLSLLGQIEQAEQRQRKQRGDSGGSSKGGGGKAGGTSGGSGSSGAGGGGGAPSFNITLNANGVNDPQRLARLIEPELKKMARLAR